eukprot:CAMPEP_0178398224 /NCGR_PEP_ID=MMETSP0689_2-20121128/14662_1 /TAXON_ID=160604 /ORGANISM="Amphidinium massartii, Strain CS-259" /LENGTH=102 /DNA_ID=CAMNT_0020018979 /DNA_START=13 /DNA_END=317 /DNA_ORIENTATION=-
MTHAGDGRGSDYYSCQRPSHSDSRLGCRPPLSTQRPPQRHRVVVRGELSLQQHLLEGGPGEVVRKTCGIDMAEDVHEKAEAADDGAFAARIGVVEEASLIHG